jgi:hypothetical protein
VWPAKNHPGLPVLVPGFRESVFALTRLLPFLASVHSNEISMAERFAKQYCAEQGRTGLNPRDSGSSTGVSRGIPHRAGFSLIPDPWGSGPVLYKVQPMQILRYFDMPRTVPVLCQSVSRIPIHRHLLTALGTSPTRVICRLFFFFVIGVTRSSYSFSGRLWREVGRDAPTLCLAMG